MLANFPISNRKSGQNSFIHASTITNNAALKMPNNFLEEIAESSGQTLSIENVRSILEQCEPVLVLIDMDCFYVQVEQLNNPETRGKPCAVVQFTDTGNGSIIALSYEAKAKGVGRFSHTKEAKEICPDIHFFTVPSRHQKADIGRYRAAGNRVLEVIQAHFSLVEKASIDEAYINVTKESLDYITSMLTSAVSPGGTCAEQSISSLHASDFNSTEVYGVQLTAEEPAQRSIETFFNITKTRLLSHPEDGGAWNCLLQLVGGLLVERLRSDILEKLQFHCSAGIACSKTLAKLCCGVNKPRRQTILPADQMKALLAGTSISKVRSYGGKYGQEIQEKLDVKNVGDLTRFKREQLCTALGDKNGDALFRLANYGLDGEEVKIHDMAKSIGSSKNFPGANCLKSFLALRKWVHAFSEELKDRVDRDSGETNRTPTLLTVHMRYYKLDELAPHLLESLRTGGKLAGRDYYLLTNHSMSRCTPLYGEWTEPRIFQTAMKVILKQFPCYVADKLYTFVDSTEAAAIEKLSTVKEKNGSAIPAENAELSEIATAAAATSSSAAKDLVFVSFIMLCAGKLESRTDESSSIRQFLVKRPKNDNDNDDEPVALSIPNGSSSSSSCKKRKNTIDRFLKPNISAKQDTTSSKVLPAKPLSSSTDYLVLSDSSVDDDTLPSSAQENAPKLRVQLGEAENSQVTGDQVNTQQTAKSLSSLSYKHSNSSSPVRRSAKSNRQSKRSTKHPRIDLFMRNHKPRASSQAATTLLDVGEADDEVEILDG